MASSNNAGTLTTPAEQPTDLENGNMDASCKSLANMEDSSYACKSASSKHGDSEHERRRPQSSVRNNLTIAVILLLGFATAAAFILYGVSTAQEEVEVQFDRAAMSSINHIRTAFEDYVTATSMIHMRCRHRNFTRQDFRETYEYIISTGLQFKAGQFAPMITHEERPAAEDEIRAWLTENYPEAAENYQGFRGFNYANSTSLEPRIDQPFYFPIHYQEPIVGNEAAIDLDYHSSESRTRAVEAMFETKGPSLTDRLSLVKKKGEVSRCGNHNGPSYGIVLMHPGIELDQPQETDQVWPRDFAAIVLCVPEVITRASTETENSRGAKIYIHDRSTPGEEAVFMGAAELSIDSNGQPQADFLDELDIEQVSAKRIKQEDVDVANRVWTITFLSVDNTYEPNYLFVALGGVMIGLATVLLAFLWHYTNAIRQAQYLQVLTEAERSTAIVTSLFPKNVAQQMMAVDASDREGSIAEAKTPPIADLFPDCTILFGDMVGFTAWSAQQEPTAVFTLLETVYNSFDEIAAKRKVFKVETVGDCYVAVCGLPEPNERHALVMARFANDCARRAKTVLKELEVELGPETSTLGFRFGLHSGPVTGGVLRGQRARFQLFGDTVNTTSRIETTGVRGKIHISSATAKLLQEGGKRHWLTEREDKVSAKGLGIITTYWLTVKDQVDAKQGSVSFDTGSDTSSSDDNVGDSDKQEQAPDNDVTV